MQLASHHSDIYRAQGEKDELGAGGQGTLICQHCVALAQQTCVLVGTCANSLLDSLKLLLDQDLSNRVKESNKNILECIANFSRVILIKLRLLAILALFICMINLSLLAVEHLAKNFRGLHRETPRRETRGFKALDLLDRKGVVVLAVDRRPDLVLQSAQS